MKTPKVPKKTKPRTVRRRKISRAERDWWRNLDRYILMQDECP